MSTDQDRLDELVAELGRDGEAGVSDGFVDRVIATARWQRVLKGVLEGLEKFVGAVAAVTKVGMGAKDTPPR